MHRGYIKLWRALLDKPIWKNSTPEQRSILIAIISMANHKENEWDWDGKRFKVNAGEFITSLASLAKVAGDGVSVRNCRTAIIRFEKLQFLTNKSTNRGRLISIINWDIYQSTEAAPDKVSDKPLTSPRQAPDKPLTTNKNVKNDKNVKNIKKKEIFGEFKNIKLTPEEHEKLKVRFPNSYQEKIENISHYIESKGDKYKSHYATILNWDRKNTKDKQQGIKPTTYAQAQDAERRTMVQIVKEMDNAGDKRSDSKGTDEAPHLLPYGKEVP